MDITFKDSARLQQYDADWYNRKRRKDGEPAREPLYRSRDAEQVLKRVRGHRYADPFEVELTLTENGQTKTLVFSGDIGQYDTPIINDPAPVERADAIIMESTYGHRHHRDRNDTIAELGDIIAAAHEDGGNILIPAFAIGRSQELLYHLGTHYDAWGMDNWQVFLDSPMAIEASRVYWEQQGHRAIQARCYCNRRFRHVHGWPDHAPLEKQPVQPANPHRDLRIPITGHTGWQACQSGRQGQDPRTVD